MLKWFSCSRRIISSGFGDVLNANSLSRQPHFNNSSGRPLLWSRHSYATEAIPFEHSSSQQVSLGPVNLTHKVAAIRNSNAKPFEPFSKSSLEQEIRWLNDPLKLGDNTVKLLRQDEAEKALALVRLASKDIECTVSWNHLIDYLMSKGKVADATKLYNEMKKRAQRPDAHTFTTLFRGYSWYPKFSLSLPRAITIYHSMFAENSPVRPSVIHTNAVLKVCALAGDIDALLGVAAKLPSRGYGSADNLTYTTVLNAIRSDAWHADHEREMSAAKQQKRIQAVRQGKRLWIEIRKRWQKGDLLLDEELVCAMGRLLLITRDERDCDDVLSLAEQTMLLSRQVPVIKDNDTRTMPQSTGLNGKSEETRSLIPVEEGSDRTQTTSSVPDDDSHDGDIFNTVPISAAISKSAVRPGRNTLSLLLDACIRTDRTRAAQNYWGLLTDPTGPYRITPDSENYHMYLRLLRTQRASKLALELIEDMHKGSLGPQAALQPKTFRIALSCCVRDKNNGNSINHARKLVCLMYITLPAPDARALSMYIQLCLSQRPVDWRALLGVIHDVDTGIRNLKSLQSYGNETDANRTDDLHELVRSTISAIDVSLDVGNEGTSGEEKKWCQVLKHGLMAWMTRRSNRIKGISSQNEVKGHRKPEIHAKGQPVKSDIEMLPKRKVKKRLVRQGQGI